MPLFHQIYSLELDINITERRVYSINKVLSHIGGLSAILTVIFRVIFNLYKTFEFDLVRIGRLYTFRTKTKKSWTVKDDKATDQDSDCYNIKIS